MKEGIKLKQQHYDMLTHILWDDSTSEIIPSPATFATHFSKKKETLLEPSVFFYNALYDINIHIKSYLTVVSLNKLATVEDENGLMALYCLVEKLRTTFVDTFSLLPNIDEELENLDFTRLVDSYVHFLETSHNYNFPLESLPTIRTIYSNISQLFLYLTNMNKEYEESLVITEQKKRETLIDTFSNITNTIEKQQGKCENRISLVNEYRENHSISSNLQDLRNDFEVKETIASSQDILKKDNNLS